jgi:hypothetical protein
MMPNADSPLQPRIVKFLDGLKKQGKLIHKLQLSETFFNKPAETLLDIEPQQMLQGDLEAVADDILQVLQAKADERRAKVRASLACGSAAILLPCRPSETPAPIVVRKNGTIAAARDGGDGFDLDDDENGGGMDGSGDSFERQFMGGGLRHQGAIFALEALTQGRATFRMAIASSLRREERDARTIDRLERQIARYQAIHEQAILAREQLLDRQAERGLEIERVKQRDKWMQDGFAKVIALIALHAPDLLLKVGVNIDPRARELLFDIVGTVGAAKPFVNAMRSAATVAESEIQKRGSFDNSAPAGARPDRGSPDRGPPADRNEPLGGGSPNGRLTEARLDNSTSGGAAGGGGAGTQTTAGAIAATTVAATSGEAVGAGGLAVFAGLTVDLLTSLESKLSMVQPMLDDRQRQLLDQIQKLMSEHGRSFVAVGQAAMAGTATYAKGDASAGGGGGGALARMGNVEDAAIMRLLDLSVQFWVALREEDVGKMMKFLGGRAKEALTEIRKFKFDDFQPPS